MVLLGFMFEFVKVTCKISLTLILPEMTTEVKLRCLITFSCENVTL